MNVYDLVSHFCCIWGLLAIFLYDSRWRLVQGGDTGYFGQVARVVFAQVYCPFSKKQKQKQKKMCSKEDDCAGLHILNGANMDNGSQSPVVACQGLRVYRQNQNQNLSNVSN